MNNGTDDPKVGFCTDRFCLLQLSAEEARFDCARKMTEVESRKRYEFLEAMVSSMDAHLRFFERGHEVHTHPPRLLVSQADRNAAPVAVLIFVTPSRR